MDPKTGRVVATLATPVMTNDSLGLAWEGGTLWVGQYTGRAIHQIDATTGKVLETMRSDRFVTGVSFVDGDVLETLEMPDGVSGLEAKGDLLFCGGIKAPVVRAVKRPSQK